ncbi:MAG: hypothetical protein NT090_05620 [Acidobacteria bacterium]|nr:hypothetical protein [Acidobacteriota bacterium]
MRDSGAMSAVQRVSDLRGELDGLIERQRTLLDGAANVSLSMYSITMYSVPSWLPMSCSTRTCG